jgi:membrane-anchored protein YejM (alkaline phosphatase superfamily)
MTALDMASWRDDGVGSFNLVRRAYSMHPAADYSFLSQDATLQNRVRAVYGDDVEDVEYIIGGLLETMSSSSPLGATFVAVLLSHFEKGGWIER